jgi:hypothetical protein
MTTEKWIERARLVHGNRYNYSKAVYVNSKTKVTIICPVHGSFEQYPGDHVNKRCGCNKCRLTKSSIYEPIKNKTSMREYRIWKAMKSRCYNPNSTDGWRYQKKGITLCNEWEESFEAFYNDMGPCPKGYSIDRIDNNGSYCKSNCRWADSYTQSGNRGEFNNRFSYNGKEMTLKDWARFLNIKYTTLYQRIYISGMSFEEAIMYCKDK